MLQIRIIKESQEQYKVLLGDQNNPEMLFDYLFDRNHPKKPKEYFVQFLFDKPSLEYDEDLKTFSFTPLDAGLLDLVNEVAKLPGVIIDEDNEFIIDIEDLRQFKPYITEGWELLNQ